MEGRSLPTLILARAATSHGYVPEEQRQDPREAGRCQCGMDEGTCNRGCFDDEDTYEYHHHQAERTLVEYEDEMHREAWAMNDAFDAAEEDERARRSWRGRLASVVRRIKGR